MPDMTAADLARLSEWHHPKDGAAVCEECGQPWPCNIAALVATVRELARAVVTAEKYVEFARQGRCYWCSGIEDHTPDCIVIRARALAGE